MILIGDAGGTSSHWRVINDDQSIVQFKTRGFNLMHHSAEDFLAAIQEDLLPFISAQSVYFYAAGYQSNSHKGVELDNAFRQMFTDSQVEVNDDILAAARALCGHQSGWVGILGTGANVAHFDGRMIKDQVAPLGFLIGDEGSGADLGKSFVRLYYREHLPDEIIRDFNEKYGVEGRELLSSIYEKNDPKVYLASFAEFMHIYKHNPLIYRAIYEHFLHHFEVFFKHKQDDLPVHYTGSIAYFFSDILRQAAVDKGIAIGQVTKDPIAGLALFHQ
jgi:glucosamine kinase